MTQVAVAIITFFPLLDLLSTSIILGVWAENMIGWAVDTSEKSLGLSFSNPLHINTLPNIYLYHF